MSLYVVRFPALVKRQQPGSAKQEQGAERARDPSATVVECVQAAAIELPLRPGCQRYRILEQLRPAAMDRFCEASQGRGQLLWLNPVFRRRRWQPPAGPD